MKKLTREQYLAQCRARRLEMKKLRKAGWTLADIAAKYGVKYQAVQSALKNI